MTRAARLLGAAAIAAVVIVATVIVTTLAVYGLNAIFGNGSSCGDSCGLGLVIGTIYGAELSVLTVPLALFFYWKRTAGRPERAG